jgi:hypothetical protein
MKSFKDRTWLIILGVAVAILVTLTTLSWNEPAPASSGSGVSSPSTNRAVLPKIANELSRHLIKPLFHSR